MHSRCAPTWAARPNPNPSPSPSPNPNPNPHPNQPLCADVGGAVEGVIEMDKILQKDFKELQDYIDESVRLYSSPSPSP